MEDGIDGSCEWSNWIVSDYIGLWSRITKGFAMKRLFNHDLVMQVREFMERFDVYQIAAKMKLDVHTVQAIIDFINGVT